MTQELAEYYRIGPESFGQMGTEEISIELGNKALLLTIDHREQVAVTYLESLDDPREPGETTEIYEIVLGLIQETATKNQQPIIYLFSTRIPKLINWAQDQEKGYRIFHWDHLEEHFEESTEETNFFAQKIIFPENN